MILVECSFTSRYSGGVRYLDVTTGAAYRVRENAREDRPSLWSVVRSDENGDDMIAGYFSNRPSAEIYLYEFVAALRVGASVPVILACDIDAPGPDAQVA